MDSLIGLFSHVPFWAWLLVALGIYLGVSATKERSVHLFKATIMPLVFLVLTAGNLITVGSLFPVILLVWPLGLILGIAVGWNYLQKAPLSVQSGKATLIIPGSYAILLLFPLVLVSKFVLGFALGTKDPVIYQPSVISLCFALGGFCAGAIIGKTARLFAWYYRFSAQPEKVGKGRS